MTVTKEELRAELERQAERYKDVYGGEVTICRTTGTGAQTLAQACHGQDQAFAQELEKWKRNCAAKKADPALHAITHALPLGKTGVGFLPKSQERNGITQI